jgi:hypothetical protein
MGNLEPFNLDEASGGNSKRQEELWNSAEADGLSHVATRADHYPARLVFKAVKVDRGGYWTCWL